MNGHPTRRPAYLFAALATAAVLAAGCSVASPSAPASEGLPTATASTAAALPTLSAAPSASISAAPSPTTSPVPSATASAAASPAALPSGWQSCINTHVGFEIGYPADWHTTQLNSEEACQQFDPMVFTIPVDGEYPMTALNAVQTDYLFDPGRSGPGGEMCVDLILREPVTVDGRQAVRYEEQISGAMTYADGTMKYGYVIDREGREFAVFTTAHPGISPGAYADWKAIVDQAVDTLRFP